MKAKVILPSVLDVPEGKHRSVFIVNELADKLMAMGYSVSAVHRDMEK